jgi:DNA-binding NarL/FixJ family response regulator
MTTIAIADDHPLVRKAFVELLGRTGLYECVMEACNGRELIDYLSAATVFPKIVLLDIMMPVMNGLQALRWIRENKPDIRVIMLSYNPAKEYNGKEDPPGIEGYISKAQPICDILELINQVAMQKDFDDSITFEIDAEVRSYASLTSREKELIHFCKTDLTYKEIAMLLHVSENTIEKQRATLFKKLEVGSRMGLVLKAIRNGWTEI